MAKDAVLREAPRESLRAATIRLAAYGEEEFLIGIPGSSGEGVPVAEIERLRARPSEPSFFDSRPSFTRGTGFSSLSGTLPGDRDALSERP